ncbi:hypothetical protein KA183_10735 [bacterium]|nr:hypothetical protein [bacterium]
MKRKSLISAFALLCLSVNISNSVLAQDIKDESTKTPPEALDTNFKALLDELHRSLKLLRLPGHEAPYFLAYNLYESLDFSVEGVLGAITTRSGKKDRSLYPIVRVGNYKLDNTNFDSTDYAEVSSTKSDTTPIDENYMALRKSVWLSTDLKYKQAVKYLDEKKALMLERNVNSALDDFSPAPAFNLINPARSMNLNKDLWTDKVRELSSVFLEFPMLRNSWVRFDERVLNLWLVNSESTIARNGEVSARYQAFASIQTKEGEVISDGLEALARDENNLPSVDQMKVELRGLGKRLTQIVQAPQGEDYDGPVLFEGQAAAEFLASTLAPNIVAKRDHLSNFSNTAVSTNPLGRKMNKRIMPTFLSLIDDPYLRVWKGKQLFGGFEIDEEGVQPQKIDIVQKGELKAFCAGRTPTKFTKTTNGHGVISDDTAQNSVLLLTSTKTNSNKDLLKMLRRLGEESGLPYVMVVRRMDNTQREAFSSDDLNGTYALSSSSSTSINLPSPILVFKVDTRSGKEVQIRGVKFAPTNIRVLKDIIAAGNDTDAYAVEQTSNNYAHLVTPSLLVRDIEMVKSEAPSQKPPVTPSPLMSIQK